MLSPGIVKFYHITEITVCVFRRVNIIRFSTGQIALELYIFLAKEKEEIKGKVNGEKFKEKS